MTRTERAVSPRALLKDRSEARNGLDTGLRKGGAGAHNWGALNDEARFEREGADDEESEPRDGEGAFAPTTDWTCADRPSVLRLLSSVCWQACAAETRRTPSAARAASRRRTARMPSRSARMPSRTAVRSSSRCPRGIDF